MPQASLQFSYALEQLYVDQDPDFVIDAIPQLLGWLDPQDQKSSHCFELREQKPEGEVFHNLILSWDSQQLAMRDPRFFDDLKRIRTQRTLTVEQLAQYAAYGLAMVVISCFLKRRVKSINRHVAPDLLLDITAPKAIRGVEVAGRSKNGYAAFSQVLEGPDGKRARLKARANLAEAYLSLWCSAPLVAHWEQVKP